MPKDFKKPSQPATSSMGYPRVEKLIDSEDFAETNQVFEETYKALEKEGRSKTGLKKGKEATRAKKAIERVTQLFRELLEVKYRLQEYIKQQDSGKK